MLSFNEMPNNSKVWIYQADRNFTDLEILEIKKNANLFLKDWSSHGNALVATIDVLHNRFVVVLVDEKSAAPGGCGIDQSVKFIQALEKEYNVNLLDRMLVAFRDENGILCSAKLQEFEKLVERGVLTRETIVFNNLMGTKEEMLSNWEVPLKKSWHARMLVG